MLSVFYFILISYDLILSLLKLILIVFKLITM